MFYFLKSFWRYGGKEIRRYDNSRILGEITGDRGR
jgi:hypothetical protein